MDAETLREQQAPLKAKYKSDSAAALVTMRATGSLVSDRVACLIDRNRSTDAAGLHPAAGGTGAELCSGDMLLEALVGCAGVTLKAVATAMGIKIDHATVMAEGECDFRGTLGVDKTAPVGFQTIRLVFDIKSDAPKEQVDQLIKLAERYCVVYQTLLHPPVVTVSAQTGGA
ncbi:MAG: OsmC family protein [Hyphomicrobiaceae bacterium]|nr:OsmC family protein [Hyphomicrobiaceae bacterium]